MFRSHILIGFVLLLSSCSDNNQPASTPNGAPAQPPTMSPQRAPSDMPKTSDNTSSAFPKGALYTIFCARIDGDLHVQRADRLKKDLIASTGMKDWYVIHDSAQSILYYGYYRSIDPAADPKEAARAQGERKKIDAMADNMGNRPFNGALFVALDAPDPSAPPDWNLANAKGAYSLQIAAYKDSPQRKEAAVETVRAARAQGVDAYFYHGETSSLVCIGAWPESAVRVSDTSSPQINNDPEQPLMIIPMTRDAAVNSHFEEMAQQNNVKVVKPTVEILDPTLRAAMEKYPYNAVNGMYTKRIVNGTEQYDTSLLVPIPHGQADVTQNAPPEADPIYRPAPQQPEPQAGMGKLKSFGD